MDEEIFTRFRKLSWAGIILIFDGMDRHLEIWVVDLDGIVDYQEEDGLIGAETHLSDSISEVDFSFGFHHFEYNSVFEPQPNSIIIQIHTKYQYDRIEIHLSLAAR